MTLAELIQSGGNGLATTGGGPSPIGPPPVPTPEQLVAVVDAQERYNDGLRLRMEGDWDMLTLKPFDAGEGYQEYTSNEPMTYFAKLTSALTSGKIKIRIPVQRAMRDKRQRESAAERFYTGILMANDERLLRLGMPVLQDMLGSFINLRGRYCGRAMLVKDPQTGETYADITPWDPLHVSWGMGPKGLKWICHKIKKTLAEVQDEYGFTPGQQPGQQEVSAEQYFSSHVVTDEEGYDVYDWYDEVNNIVVIGGEYAKPPTPHTPLNRVPAFYGVVGPLPLIQSRSHDGRTNLVHHGESIFAANRRIYAKINLVLSTMLQLVALSRNQAFTYMSRDGTKTVAQNPWLEGAQTPLAEGEELKILELLKMSADTGAFLGLVSAEIQRGALPYSVYGQLAFQLSGYAVNLLKQATDSPILPRQRAMEQAYTQITRLIGDQFSTGAYGAMQLQGWGQNRAWFDEEFEPQMIRGLPAAQISLKVNTPQDDLQKMQLADIASQGPWPKLSMRYIWDEILDIQDTDSMADEIKEEVGEKMVPAAALMTLRDALQKQGRTELVPIYEWELWKQAMMGGINPGGATGSGAPGKNVGGVSPENLSAPEQGAPTPQPTPQQGPNVTPGSPRPGAQAQP